MCDAIASFHHPKRVSFVAQNLFTLVIADEYLVQPFGILAVQNYGAWSMLFQHSFVIPSFVQSSI